MRATNRLPGKRQVVRPAALLRLRGSPGRPSLASLQEELTNLELARRIELPPDLFDHVSTRGPGDQIWAVLAYMGSTKIRGVNVDGVTA